MDPSRRINVQPTLQTDSLFVERDTHRKIRQRNKIGYRLNHWPIWIFVFFIAPGPMTFTLFEQGSTRAWPRGWRRCSSAPGSPG